MYKIKLASIFLVVCFLLGGSGGYYWWIGTPEYSMSQLKKAIEKHDPELGLKYVDGDSIFENIWLDLKKEFMRDGLAAEGFDGLGTMIGIQMMDNMKSVMKEEFDQGIESWFSQSFEDTKESVGETQNESEAIDIWHQNFEIEKKSNLAVIDLQNGVKIILSRKEGERYWVISEIEGFSGLLSDVQDIDQNEEEIE